MAVARQREGRGSGSPFVNEKIQGDYNSAGGDDCQGCTEPALQTGNWAPPPVESYFQRERMCSRLNPHLCFEVFGGKILDNEY